MPLELTITNAQKVQVKLKPSSLTGRPATLDGPASWSVTVGDATVEPGADGLSAYLVSADTLGDTLYVVKGDGDLGEGVVEIQDTILLHVVSENAANLGLFAGPAEDK